jgi:LysM repeat protein
MMRNRLSSLVTPALLALLLLAGCMRGDAPPAADETTDPEFQRGRQLEQDRPQEALAAYLKVIARRGEDDSAESHLGAGVIYLQYVKDPIRAIYHFQKYLELQPNSRRADFVRQQIDAAKRDFVRTLRPQPIEMGGDLTELQDRVSRLQRENDQLKADLATARAGGPPPPAPVVGKAPSGGGPRIVLAPIAQDSMVTLVPLNPPAAPATASPVQAAQAGPGSRAAPAKPAAGGRRHTVQPGDTLYKIAQRYYGASGATARAKAVFEANRDVMKSQTDLKPGMELKIP